MTATRIRASTACATTALTPILVAATLVGPGQTAIKILTTATQTLALTERAPMA